jgi:fructan beta-fructosidase
MAVYDEDRELREPDRRGVAFYTSPDLRRWTYRSRIGGFYECPDMFELPVDGGKNGTKWVLTAANSEYLLGQFDGEKFTPDASRVKLPGNRGDRFYAAQTFSQTPDGRRIQMGWGQIETRGMPFNQMMSFPCELTLRTTAEEVRMFSWPVSEIDLLHGKLWRIESAEIAPGKPVRSDAEGELLDVQATIETRTAAAVELAIRGMRIRLDFAAGRISCGERSAPLPIRDGRVAVRALVDRTSIEVFVNGGEIAMLMSGAFGGSGVTLTAEGGTASAVELIVHEMRSAWDANR